MKTLVEACFQLNTKPLKKDLRHVREQKTGIGGAINISYGNIKSVADYYIEYGAENNCLIINYREEEQRIKLAESELTFGTRSWFICDCERRVSKLYLPPLTKQFKCRHCHKLKYELTTFNHNTIQGRLFYTTNRMIKLANARAEINRIFYKGVYTKRFLRHLSLFSRAGFNGPAEDAKKLFEAIYSQ